MDSNLVVFQHRILTRRRLPIEGQRRSRRKGGVLFCGLVGMPVSAMNFFYLDYAKALDASRQNKVPSRIDTMNSIAGSLSELLETARYRRANTSNGPRVQLQF